MTAQRHKPTCFTWPEKPNELTERVRTQELAAFSEWIKQAVESMGGTLEAYYFAFGHSDIVSLVDLPSNTAAAALAAAFAAGGAVSSLATTPLLTPEEIDEAAKLHPDYTPPGDPAAAGR